MTSSLTVTREAFLTETPIQVARRDTSLMVPEGDASAILLQDKMLERDGVSPDDWNKE